MASTKAALTNFASPIHINVCVCQLHNPPHHSIQSHSHVSRERMLHMPMRRCMHEQHRYTGTGCKLHGISYICAWKMLFKDVRTHDALNDAGSRIYTMHTRRTTVVTSFAWVTCGFAVTQGSLYRARCTHHFVATSALMCVGDNQPSCSRCIVNAWECFWEWAHMWDTKCAFVSLHVRSCTHIFELK